MRNVLLPVQESCLLVSPSHQSVPSSARRSLNASFSSRESTCTETRSDSFFVVEHVHVPTCTFHVYMYIRNGVCK